MRLAPTHFVNLSCSCLVYSETAKPVPAREEQNLGTPTVTHDRYSYVTFCLRLRQTRSSARIEGYGIAHRHGVNGSFTVADKPSL
jgi:hypothetical protein